MDTRESVPNIMKEKGLVLLPVKNGFYAIIKGEGYVDIPDIEGEAEKYNTKLNFDLDTAKIGDSEMQHLILLMRLVSLGHSWMMQHLF